MIGCHERTSRAARLTQRTRIKICGLTREQDVDAAVAAGADAVGFVMYAKSPRFVSPERAAELARRLPPFVTPVLLFVNEPAAPGRGGLRTRARLRPSSSMATRRRQQCLEATAGGRRPFLRAARIPLDDTPVRLAKIRFRLRQCPGHPARRPCRGIRRRRESIQLVTSSTKRQLSPRFVWWIDACKRDRWHRAGAAAL